MMLGGTFEVPATSMVGGTCIRLSWKLWGVAPLMVMLFIASNGRSAQPISVAGVPLSNNGSLPLGKLMFGGVPGGGRMIIPLLPIACLMHGPPHGLKGNSAPAPLSADNMARW